EEARKKRLCELDCHVWIPVIHAGVRIRNLYACPYCGIEKKDILPPYPKRE
ncbi:unnamed protein product, partial [marine sediment metagenome]